MNGAFSLWWRSDATKDHKVVPFIISWGLWIMNDSTFKDLTKTHSEIAIKVVVIIEYFLDLAPNVRVRTIVQELINQDMPWGYFDGATGGVPGRCGGGVVLHFDM